MNKRHEAFLCVLGLAREDLLVFSKQIEAVNRIGARTCSLSKAWRLTDDLSKADAVCLIDQPVDKKIESLHIPVLTNDVNQAGEYMILIRYPTTAFSLMDWMQSCEKLMEVGEARSEALPTKISSDTTDAHAYSSNIGEGETSEETQNKPRNGDEVPFSKDYFFKRIKQEDTDHIRISWSDAALWIDLSEKKVTFLNSDSIQAASYLAHEEPNATLVCNQSCPEGKDTNKTSLASFLWSLGLRTDPDEIFMKRMKPDENEYKLKRWPVFGQWETHSRLLFLTTLFAQKFSSVSEAQIKSSALREDIIRFLWAADLAGLPFDVRKVDDEQAAPQAEKKKDIGWINRLREKLNMDQYL